jgi:hypothetical protein
MKRLPASTVICDTQAFWSARIGRPVSEEDAREAIRNVTAFFDLLAEWDQQANSAQTDDVEVVGHGNA